MPKTDGGKDRKRGHYMKKKVFSLGMGVLALFFGFVLTGCNTLQSIEISRGPERAVLGQGQWLDPEGLAVTVIRSRDTEVITDARGMAISGFDPTIPGQQTVTVTYGRGRRAQTATFTVTVVPVASLTITQVPTVTMIMEGDDFDPAGLVAWVEFEDEAVPGEEIGPGWHLSFSGFDRNASGAQTVTASFFGRTDTFEVRVAAFLGIEITSLPIRTEYFVGEALDLSGLAVLGRWDGYERPLVITQEHLSNFDINRSGQQEVLITYLNSTAGFSVTYVGFVAITITSPPSRVTLGNGEHLNLAGMQLQGTREGSTTIEMLDVSRAQISGFDRFRGGEQTVTVSFGGRSDTFRVTVGPNPFIATWTGTRTAGRDELSLTLTMAADNTWTLSWPAVQGGAHAQTFSGTFTRDTETGRTASLTITGTEGPNRANTGPSNVEILSPRELRLTGGVGIFSGTGATLTR